MKILGVHPVSNLEKAQILLDLMQKYPASREATLSSRVSCRGTNRLKTTENNGFWINFSDIKNYFRKN